MKPSFRHDWILAILRKDPGLVEKPMFGCRAAWLRGKIVAVLADGKSPWNGFLVPTERAHHEGLMKRWPELRPHPVLGKWLWIAETSPDFESTAAAIAERIRKQDPLLGAVPKPKKPPKKKAR